MIHLILFVLTLKFGLVWRIKNTLMRNRLKKISLNYRTTNSE